VAVAGVRVRGGILRGSVVVVVAAIAVGLFVEVAELLLLLSSLLVFLLFLAQPMAHCSASAAVSPSTTLSSSLAANRAADSTEAFV
jgi:hypothetical protein